MIRARRSRGSLPIAVRALGLALLAAPVACGLIAGLEELRFSPSDAGAGPDGSTGSDDAIAPGDVDAASARFCTDAGLFCADWEAVTAPDAGWSGATLSPCGTLAVVPAAGHGQVLECTTNEPFAPGGGGLGCAAFLVHDVGKSVTLPVELTFEARLEETAGYDGGGVSGFSMVVFHTDTTPAEQLSLLLGMNDDSRTMTPYITSNEPVPPMELGTWYRVRLGLGVRDAGTALMSLTVEGPSGPIVNAAKATAATELRAFEFGPYVGSAGGRYRIRFDNVLLRRVP